MRTFLLLASLTAFTLPASGATAQIAVDKAIAQRISSHLEQSGQLRNYRIGVTYQEGIASLTGAVASEEQRNTAIRLAEQVTGVSRVDCRLEIPRQQRFASGDERGSSSRPLGEARTTMAEGQPAGVMHAYGDDSTGLGIPAERSPSPAQTGSVAPRRRQMPRHNMPLPAPRPGMRSPIQQVSAHGVQPAGGMCPPGYGGPMDGGAAGGMGAGSMGMQGPPAGFVPHGQGRGPSYDNPQMPGYAWPSYASYPNYAALSYPQQYSPTAWPYIGPFYPYPQVPLAWRKVALEWDDGWWFLDFSSHNSSH
jgi:BON domain